MNDKLEFTGYVRNGVLIVRNKHEFEQSVKRFDGKDVEIIVQKKRLVRSIQQNRLWWLYMTLLSEATGYTKDEMHDICKFKFCKRERVIEKTGEVIEYLQDTSRMTRTEFSEVVDKVIQWAAEMDIILPIPNEQLSF